MFLKGCASDEMRFIGVYCALSVLNSPWYLPADLPSSLTDISGLGFAFFFFRSTEHDTNGYDLHEEALFHFNHRI